MTQHTIQVIENDGYKRGGVAYGLDLTFTESECPGPDHTRVIHPDGTELPIQMDITRSWPDGSVRSAHVAFPLRLPANGSGTYRLEAGPDVSPEAHQRNPVQIDSDNTGYTINQGPVTYRVNTDDFNVVDTAVFDRDVWGGTHPTGADISGPKSFLRAGSPATSLITHDGTQLAQGQSVSAEIETSGPRTGTIAFTGTFDGGIDFTSHLTFYSGVSWYRHVLTLSGNTDDIASVQLNDTFDLAEGTLLTAYGARTNSVGTPTSWAVVTDDVSTIDVAVTKAWSDAGYVRYESEADGKFRIIAPFTGEPIVAFYHFLITPPADEYHTPAGAMVADPQLKLIAS